MTVLTTPPETPKTRWLELPAAEADKPEQRADVCVDNATLLFKGLAAQFPMGTLGNFLGNKKTLTIWALALEKAHIQEPDVRAFLKYIASGEDEFTYNDIGLPKIVRMATNLRKMRLDREEERQRYEAARARASDTTPRLAAPKKPDRREWASKHIKAVRNVLNASQGKLDVIYAYLNHARLYTDIAATTAQPAERRSTLYTLARLAHV